MFHATTSRFAAFALAVSVTLAIVAGIATLADGQVASAQFFAATMRVAQG